MKKQKMKEKKEDKMHQKRDLENDKQVEIIENGTGDQVNIKMRKKKKAMEKEVDRSNVDASNHSNFSGNADSNKKGKLKKDKLKKGRKIKEKNDLVTSEQLGTDVEEQNANLNETDELVNMKRRKKKKKAMRKEVVGSNVDVGNLSNFRGKADSDKKENLKKDKIKKERKIKEQNDTVMVDQLGTNVEDGVEELNANLVEQTKENKNTKLKKKRKMDARTNNRTDHQANSDAEEGIKEPKGKFKKAKKMKKKNLGVSKEKFPEKSKEDDKDEVYDISAGDEDCTRGMQKWVTDYYNSRPGLKVLQERIDDFITVHEERLEQERKEREAKAAEGGWTVVVHHKGRKKTTDSESGITVGSVAQAAVEDKMSKKKQKEVVAQDFYRFQKREAHRSEIMMLQSKFEQDRKRIQQLRAARKFKPY